MDVNIILLFIIIPALIRARIVHNIYFDNVADSYRLQMYGSSESIISDDDIRSFTLTDSNLKDGVRVLLGKPPKDVFLRRPTPWNDLYRRYGWPEVRTKLEPVEWTIKDVSSRQVVLYEQIYFNNSTAPVVHSVGASQTLEQPVATTWSKKLLASENEEILYSIGVKGVKRFSFMSQWGKSEIVYKTLTIGTSEDVQVTVNPGQAIDVQLMASIGNVRIEIDYRTTFNGSVAVNFNPKYKPPNDLTSHHFFSLDVNDVLSSANLPRVFNSTETISVTFYSDAKVTVHDRATGSVLLEVPVEVEIKKGEDIKPL